MMAGQVMEEEKGRNREEHIKVRVTLTLTSNPK